MIPDKSTVKENLFIPFGHVIKVCPFGNLQCFSSCDRFRNNDNKGIILFDRKGAFFHKMDISDRGLVVVMT